MWALRRFNCPESYTSPSGIYRSAKKRGMDYVTITDHNSIEGALEIAHLPGTFMSTELTSYFPEDGCKVHVVALGIDRDKFSDLLVLRKNVYELADYLRGQNLAHFLAHPLFDINGKLSLEKVEKFLLLFDVFEVRNGARAKHYNQLFEEIVGSLTPELMERLADKHGIELRGEDPWRKGLVGGSDDHSGLYVAQAFTESTACPTLDEFLASVRQRRTRHAGEDGSPLTLAHSIYSIAYQFFGNHLKGRKTKSYPFLETMLHGLFGDGSRKVSKMAKLKLALKNAMPEVYGSDDESKSLEELLDHEIRRLLNDKKFRERLSASTLNRRIFVAASHLANRLFYIYTQKLATRAMSQGIMDLVNAASTIGFVHLVTAPYYIAHRSQTRSKPFLAELRARFELPGEPVSRKIALFTDTLDDVNGVALTIRRLLHTAQSSGTELVVMTCSDEPTGIPDGVMNFQSLGDFKIPEYPDLRIHFPPILDVLDYIGDGASPRST